MDVQRVERNSLALWSSEDDSWALLHELGYSLQLRKSREGASHPERNAQFEHINATADECLQRHQPVATKKKELVGEFKNAGREWQPKNKPETALVHDFPHDASGKAHSLRYLKEIRRDPGSNCRRQGAAVK